MLYHDFLSFLTAVLLITQLYVLLFVDGLPMKKNILKASSSYLKKEILKTVMPLGH